MFDFKKICDRLLNPDIRRITVQRALADLLKGGEILKIGGGRYTAYVSVDDKRSPISENDIPDIIARFKNLEAEKDRKRTDKSYFVHKDEIAANAYDLSINKYKKTEYVPVEYPSIIEIMATLDELEMEIGKEMEALKGLLVI